MNSERGFPIPKHKNGDSLSSVTRGMPVPRESGIEDTTSSPKTPIPLITTKEATISQANEILQNANDGKPVTPGNSFPHMNGIGQSKNSWIPVTPEKLTDEKSIKIAVGVEENKSESDNWRDLLGMYTGLLKEETHKNQGATSVSYFRPNDPANWKCNHLASIVCSKRSSSSTSQTQTSNLNNFISNAQTSKDEKTSSNIVDSFPLEPAPAKTPQQKTPTRRKKHRPRVIKPQKPKKDPKNGNTTPGETRVKRKYVKKKGVNISETQQKTPGANVVKRKYVRKENIKGRQKKAVKDTAVKSCKKKLNFDLDENVNPRDIEQEKLTNSNCYIPLPVVHVPIAKPTHNAFNMTMNPQENRYYTVHSNLQKIQQPDIRLDERRGIKRQNSPMDSMYLYKKLLLGVAHRSHNHNVLMENHKRRKINMQSEFQVSNVIYNGSLMQLLNSSQKVNPANVINYQYQPDILQYSHGNQIGWNCPQSITPQEGFKYGVITYPATLLQKKPSVYNQRIDKGEVSVDDVIRQLERLRIYDGKKKGGNEKGLVLYKGSNAIVPFEPIKKRNRRPKVDLDPETERLWRLLMGKEGSEEGESLDKDKEKWWENERRVFRGRADSFIARMHLVQGDRRFSRWKGSVVDSVIGVFLTQNVSDHLSSSAFMSLAAKFPLKACNENGECEVPTEVTNPKDIIKRNEDNNETTSDQNYVVSSEESCEIKHDKVSEEEEEVIVSQNSVDSPTVQTVDETKSNSWSNSETEDVKPGLETNVTEVLKETTHDNKNDVQKQDSKEQNDTHEPPSGTGTGAGTGAYTSKEKKRMAEDEKNREMDWDSLRKEAVSNGEKREENKNARDSMDYEALRHAPDKEISDVIKERGMNNLLADRMKEFLNRLVRDHEKIDLEWLRDAPPDKAKDYLLSFRGLGLKSVECVRLLTLHHLAFPVDTNVGRIAVRLGWVPLQPLPESLQLHLLEMYPVLDSIQKYLWPRLCKLDQLTLYELHYQMITFGKVFCTKSKPNCNACPMRAECRHFASAFASARLALPGPEEKKTTTSNSPIPTNPLLQLENKNEGKTCEPIIEEPTTPEPEPTELSLSDIEDHDQYYEDSDEIPSIKLNMEDFTNNLQNIMQDNKELRENMSKALVALNPKAAYIPTPKLKDVSRLRTEHQVYELPDSHRLLEGFEKRETDDPSPYLLAIWTPGETANSVQPPERECSGRESGSLCDKTTCFSCNSVKEANSQVVRGTILIPCRTAMRGSFPLNGTYFQVNEMFADHASSLKPIDVPRSWIWNLPRRTVYFGTSVSTIFKGLSTQGIQYCFWKGFVCVRGFDRETRAPRPLMARLHFPTSKLIKIKNEGK